jgi:hypothetical protein
VGRKHLVGLPSHRVHWIPYRQGRPDLPFERQMLRGWSNVLRKRWAGRKRQPNPSKPTTFHAKVIISCVPQADVDQASNGHVDSYPQGSKSATISVTKRAGSFFRQSAFGRPSDLWPPMLRDSPAQTTAAAARPMSLCGAGHRNRKCAPALHHRQIHAAVGGSRRTAEPVPVPCR